MKKIPTLFERVYKGHKIVDILPNITPGCERALLEGTPTIKWDGACCAFIDGVFYKRYDAKKGKKAPEGAIPCCEPDPITGHHPHWVKVNPDDPADKWFMAAYNQTAYAKEGIPVPDGTYEAIGKYINGNPYNLEGHYLMLHGDDDLSVIRTFDGIKNFLERSKYEGIVFWLDGEPVCKIKRSDFGFEWPIKMKESED